MQNKKNRMIIGVFAFLAFIIAVLFQYAYYKTNLYNEQKTTLEIKANEYDDKLSFKVERKASWSASGKWDTVGAEYDIELINNTSDDFYDWEIKMKYPKNGKLDSIWNAVNNAGDNSGILELRPKEYNPYIMANNSIPYGFVLITDELVEFDSITVTGYFIKKWNTTVLFKVCIGLTILWIAGAAVTLFMRLRIMNFERRQARDEAIIIHTMDTLVDFIEAKDEYTHGHSRRVAEYTKKIAERMHIAKDTVREYYYIALMHDCGKIGIPDEILNKAGKLTTEEFEIMKTHTTVGAQMLANFTDIKGIQEGALQHHERYDGTGYPNGLKCSEISLIGRIICVADSFDAMNIDRCYRDGLSPEEIVKRMKDGSGTQFDPTILEVFLQLLDEGEIKAQEKE